ncbi:MAG: alcohol dehydrogenase catalytic domain-containing protein [Synergistaceae bacterium]|jgi:threonine 3-dehydrogenase|nr:alcohol dehydrogenase catalytic domain-containing protein [Synergistaceae bacterium]
MKALVKTEEAHGASYQTMPMPVPAEGEVLLQVGGAAICGTDLHVFAWNDWATHNVHNIPLIMGHEFAGTVVELGPRCRDLKVGDVVAGETHITCGHCYQCRNGMRHICANLIQPGLHRNGSFAEFMAYPEEFLVKLPKGISMEQGTVLEPLGVGVSAVENIRPAGDNVVVIGSGPIGLAVILSAHAMGASDITALDLSPYRLSLASKCGATRTINTSSADPTEAIMEVTHGVGADVIFDASGSPAAISHCFKYLRKGGSVHLLGLPSSPTPIDLSPDVIFKEATIHGYHGRKIFSTWTRMINLIESGKIDPLLMITHRVPLSEAVGAFELLERGGDAGKIIFTFGGEGK